MIDRKKNEEKGISDGYVKDGIEYIKGFRQIIIHERCKNTAVEFGAYSYQQDKQTEEILPKIEDKYNHFVDALRYALSTYIRLRPKRKFVTFDF